MKALRAIVLSAFLLTGFASHAQQLTPQQKAAAQAQLDAIKKQALALQAQVQAQQKAQAQQQAQAQQRAPQQSTPQRVQQQAVQQPAQSQGAQTPQRAQQQTQSSPGSYKGVAIRAGSDADIQAQMRAIDASQAQAQQLQAQAAAQAQQKAQAQQQAQTAAQQKAQQAQSIAQQAQQLQAQANAQQKAQLQAIQQQALQLQAQAQAQAKSQPATRPAPPSAQAITTNTSPSSSATRPQTTVQQRSQAQSVQQQAQQLQAKVQTGQGTSVPSPQRSFGSPTSPVSTQTKPVSVAPRQFGVQPASSAPAATFGVSNFAAPPAAPGIAASTPATYVRPANSIWNKVPVVRGAEAEEDLLGRTPNLSGKNFRFPTIDDFTNGVATSLKTIDLNATSYNTANGFKNKIESYARELSSFAGAKKGELEVKASDIRARVLRVGVEPGQATPQQQATMEQIKLDGQLMNPPVEVEFDIIP